MAAPTAGASSTTTMTEAEEQELLDQFGTKSIYDHLLGHIQAPSKYQSQWDPKNRDLFSLTGADVNGDQHDDEQLNDRGPTPPAKSDAFLPLDLAVMKAVGDNEDQGPEALHFVSRLLHKAKEIDTQSQMTKLQQRKEREVENYQKDMDALKGYFDALLDGADDATAMRKRNGDTTNNAEETNRLKAVLDEELANGGANGRDLDELLLDVALRDLDDVVEAAEAEAKRDHHYDPSADPEAVTAKEEMEKALAEPFEFNDEELDDESSKLTAEEMAELERVVEERIECSEDRTPTRTSTKVTKVGEDVPIYLDDDEKVALEAMAAEDEELLAKRRTIMEKQAEVQRQVLAKPLAETIQETQRALEALQGGSNTLWPQPKPIAEVIHEMEHVSTQLVELEELSQRATNVTDVGQTPAGGSVTNGNSTIANMSAPGRDQQRLVEDQQALAVPPLGGNIEFLEFESKIECLLPIEEDHVSPAVVDDDSDIPTASAATAAKKKLTVAQMAKQTARRQLLQKLEARERRLMRIEDDRMASHLREVEHRENEFNKNLDAIQTAEATGRKQIDTDSHLKHVDILTREQRQRGVIHQYLAHQQEQNAAKATNEVVTQEASARQNISDIESYEWIDMMHNAESSKQKAADDCAERLQAADEAERERVKGHNKRATSFWDDVQSAAGKNVATGKAPVALPSSKVSSVWEKRHDALEQQAKRKATWAQTARREITTTLQAISQQLAGATNAKNNANNSANTSARTSPIPAAPPTPPPRGDAVEEGQPLNSKLIRTNHSLLFGAAELSKSSFRHIFTKLSVTMENVDKIDVEDIAKHLVAEPSGIDVSVFVKILDLSGNQIQRLAFQDILSAFPTLMNLKIRDNALEQLFHSHGKQSTAGDKQQQQVGSHVQHLDVSANKLTTLDGVRGLPNLKTLSAFSNLIENSQALSSCPGLFVVEVNRNKLKELDGLRNSSQPTMMLLDCSRNQIADLSAVASSLLLESLYASSNRITSFPTTFPLVFLQQLFLSENSLTELPSSAGWLPMLSVLQLESNKLTDVSGLRNFPLLTRLRLSFNHLPSLAALLPILSCSQLNSLSINDNPVVGAAKDPSVEELRRRSEAHSLLLQGLPLLRELDNEPVTATQRRLALHRAAKSLEPILTVAAGRLHQQGSGVLLSAAGKIQPSRLVQLAATATATKKPSPVFALDDQLRSLRSEYDAVTLALNSRHQMATSYEDDLFGRAKSRTVDQAPLPSLLLRTSDDIWRNNYSSRLQLAQRQLHTLQEGSTMSMSQASNVFVKNGVYDQRAMQYKEERSKKVVADFLYYSYLSLKAKKEVQALREKSEAYRQKRLGWAATVIGPRWRGAVVRMRLKRVTMEDLDDDDDMVFDKTPVGQLDMGQFGSVAAMMQTAMKHGAVQHGPVDKFSLPQKLQPRPSDDIPRVNSAPHEGNPNRVGPQLGASDRPSSGPLNNNLSASPPAGRNANQRPGAGGGGGGTQVDDAWGAGIAHLVRKKEKKIEKAKAQSLRREYVTDPLKAKQRTQR